MASEMSYIKRILCFFTGHPCVATGRHGYVLHEWRCQRCSGLYVSHTDHGRWLIPADAGSDRIFCDKNWIRKL